MALYGGYQPYQPMYQPYTQQGQQNGIIWVSGEAGAKAYLVAPNNTVQLWDSEAQVIYLKSADASGMPSIKVLDYTIRETAQNGANKPPVVSDKEMLNFATKDEIKAISDEITVIRKKLKEMEVPKV